MKVEKRRWDRRRWRQMIGCGAQVEGRVSSVFCSVVG